MKGKFHINKKGEVGKCDAGISSCPFGGESGSDNHYETQDEAKEAYEQQNKDRVLAKKQKFKKNGLRMIAIGGLLVTSVNVTGCTIEQSHHFYDDEKIDQIKEEGSKAKESVKKKAGEGMEEYKKQKDEYSSSSESSSGSSAGTDPSDIYFQGDPLQPTKDEVKEAKDYISNLETKEERVDPYYNRDEQYGPFKAGVVERAENRDVTNGQFEDSSGQSRAIGGDFIDPYTGDKVTIVEGDRNDTNVDHIIPLHEVEQSLDQEDSLSRAEKVSIANDMDNLQIVSASENKSKSDQDPSEWLPSYEPSQCTYVVSIIKVKKKYDLNTDRAESNAIKDVLDAKC